MLMNQRGDMRPTPKRITNAPYIPKIALHWTNFIVLTLVLFLGYRPRMVLFPYALFLLIFVKETIFMFQCIMFVYIYIWYNLVYYFKSIFKFNLIIYIILHNSNDFKNKDIKHKHNWKKYNLLNVILINRNL